MRVVCVGDSITFGQYVDSAAWPERIGAVGRGVCGETTRQALERFPADVQTDPGDVTVLQWGHNDANRWASDAGLTRVSLRAFHANFVEMIERCHAVATRPALCALTPTQKSRQYDCDVYYYDEELRSVALEAGVPLIDVRAAFEAEDRAELLLPDGVHLSEAGHELYASVVSQALAVAFSKVAA